MNLLKVAQDVQQLFTTAFFGVINFNVKFSTIDAWILLDAVVAVEDYLAVSTGVKMIIENKFELLVGFVTVEEADFCVGEVESFDLATFECTCKAGFILRDLETQIQSCDVEISFVEVVMIEFLGKFF